MASGDTVTVDGHILRRGEHNEGVWTGDFRLWDGDDWEAAIRPGAHYYGVVRTEEGLAALLGKYQEKHPADRSEEPGTREVLWLN